MIKKKTGNCIDCDFHGILIAKRCKFCYWKFRAKTKKTPPPSKNSNRINYHSEKRRRQNILYIKKRRIFIEQNKTCQAQLVGCSGAASEIHHKKGRIGELLTDERYFLALCRSCHNYIELNPSFAKEKSFSIVRLA